MDVDIGSFVAEGYHHHFDKRERRAFGIAKGEEIGTFILARRTWSVEWEIYAVGVISDLVADHGLAQFGLLRWQSRPAGLSLDWDCVVEYEGPEAVIRWREMMRVDAAGSGFRHSSSLLIWSTDDGATKVLARPATSDRDDRGYPPGTSAWPQDRDTGIPLMIFFVWGEDIRAILTMISSAALWAAENFREARYPDEVDRSKGTFA